MSQRVLWSGRFGGGAASSTLDFSTSLPVDTRMADHDILGSIAHVAQLKSTGVLEPDECDVIIGGLRDILDRLGDGGVDMDPSLEDVHSNMEFALIETVGRSGARLHTGRSRNDQVATDFRMYLRDGTLDLVDAVLGMVGSLTTVARANTSTVMPGFTHMQHAQPVSLAFHLLAHSFRLLRDCERLMDAFGRMNRCPLGSAALAGTTYPLDRGMTSRLLAFDAPTENAMDSVSDRDFALEFLFDCSLLATHLSSICEELILWSGPEFGWVEMDDAYSTGSSIMPQKKNPDVCELVRGRAGSVIGDLVSLLVTVKGLPMAYNRDLQEDKGPTFHALDTLIPCLTMLTATVSTMALRPERMRAMAEEGFLNATDLADYLVGRGMPFREAHSVVGGIVRDCISRSIRIDDMTMDELRSRSDLIDDDVMAHLSIEGCMERRSSLGGTSSASVGVQLESIDASSAAIASDVESRRRSIVDAYENLRRGSL